MVDEALLAQLNGPYVCPAEAGPAWRTACEYGFDMSLVEDALRKTPEERLEEHQRALNLVLDILAARKLHSPHGPSLNLDAAIAAKEAVGRARDLEATTQLRAIKERTQAQTDN